MAKPLHTSLKDVFRNLSTQNVIRVYLKETDKENGTNPHTVQRNQLTGLKILTKKNAMQQI